MRRVVIKSLYHYKQTKPFSVKYGPLPGGHRTLLLKVPLKKKTKKKLKNKEKFRKNQNYFSFFFI